MGGSGIIKLPYGMGDGLIAGSGTFLDSNRPWCIRHSELYYSYVRPEEHLCEHDLSRRSHRRCQTGSSEACLPHGSDDRKIVHAHTTVQKPELVAQPFPNPVKARAGPRWFGHANVVESNADNK